MIQNQYGNAMPGSDTTLLLRLAVTLIGLSAFFQVYSVQAILPLLVFDLKATEVQAGLSVGATVLGVALMSPFMGMLSDAVGRKVLIVGSLLFLTVPTALLAGVQTIEQMIMLRFLQGVAVPGITVVLIAYIGEEFDDKTMTRLMSLYVTGTVLGGFLGRFILGHLSEVMGWRQAFYVMAVFTVMCTFFAWKQLPASRKFVANPHFHTTLNTLSGHLKNRCVISACLLGACLLCSLVGCFTYINLHLAETPYSLDSGSLANLFTVYLIGMVITPLSSKLIARFGNVPTIILAVALSAAGVIGTLAAPLPIIIGALALISSGVFITQAATISYIAANVKEGRSLASGLYYMAYYGGGTVGAWLCGLAYTHYAWPGVTGVLLSVQASALLITIKGMLRPSEK